MHAAVAVLLSMTVVTADASSGSVQPTRTRVRQPVVVAVDNEPAAPPVMVSDRPAEPVGGPSLQDETASDSKAGGNSLPEEEQTEAEPRRFATRRAPVVVPAPPVALPKVQTPPAEPAPTPEVVLTSKQEPTPAAAPPAPLPMARTTSAVQESDPEMEFIESEEGMGLVGRPYHDAFVSHHPAHDMLNMYHQPPRLRRNGKVPLCRSTCNLRQHMGYFPYAHGNYYFRPYTFTRLLQQQEQAARMGIDPRHPYSNDHYRKIYEEFETRIRVEEVPPGVIPGEIEGIPLEGDFELPDVDASPVPDEETNEE